MFLLLLYAIFEQTFSKRLHSFLYTFTKLHDGRNPRTYESDYKT